MQGEIFERIMIYTVYGFATFIFVTIGVYNFRCAFKCLHKIVFSSVFDLNFHNDCTVNYIKELHNIFLSLYVL